MKKSLFALAVCLGLVFATAWLVVRPVYAMNVEVTCRDGSKRSCTGQTCTGSDFVENGTNGWCQCTSYTPGSPADGSIPLQNLFLLSHLYLREQTPPELRARFFATVVRVTSLTPAQLRTNPGAGGSAIQLLRASLPQMQTLTPALYAEAAARLANLSGGRPTESEVFSRIRASADPLAKTLEEASSAGDKQLKSELLEAAAQMAREQGKLRMAVELMLSAGQVREDTPRRSRGATRSWSESCRTHWRRTRSRRQGTPRAPSTRRS